MRRDLISPECYNGGPPEVRVRMGPTLLDSWITIRTLQTTPANQQPKIYCYQRHIVGSVSACYQWGSTRPDYDLLCQHRLSPPISRQYVYEDIMSESCPCFLVAPIIIRTSPLRALHIFLKLLPSKGRQSLIGTMLQH